MQPSLKVKQVLRLCTGLCAAQGEFRTSRLAARDACEHPCYAAVLSTTRPISHSSETVPYFVGLLSILPLRHANDWGN